MGAGLTMWTKQYPDYATRMRAIAAAVRAQVSTVNFSIV